MRAEEAQLESAGKTVGASLDKLLGQPSHLCFGRGRRTWCFVRHTAKMTS